MATTSTKKVGEGTSDEFIIIALPKDDYAFSDKSTVKIISGLSQTEALETLRDVRSMKAKENNLDEAGNIMLVKGVIQPILEDFTAVKIDDTEYSIKDSSQQFVQSFVNITH